LKEVSKDIEESKKLAAELGAEDQQKEKLQTKLEKLTAQKNAIEQKKQALLIFDIRKARLCSYYYNLLLNILS
jgi:ABC-type Fe3+-citrate transport system substrate-binding protein